jgi:leader peptidase (prepilin peptidase)/N-methyltransferase
MFDPEIWAKVPFHLWSVLTFILGTMVGSFLNVCIHRLPRGESVVSPASHCPHCQYAIPAYLNLPIITWISLRGRCANCNAPISVRYLLVELLTGLLFLASWLMFGQQSPAIALAHCLLLAGFIAATFIDFEHFIIPDEITIGGIIAGFVCSFFIPGLHVVWPYFERAATPADGLKQSILGILAGGGVVYAILRGGKLLFGRQNIQLDSDSRLIFTETDLHLGPDKLPYHDIFYRPSDTLRFEASRLELIDRCYANVTVRLSIEKLQIDDETLPPEEVPFMEARTNHIVLPREAMGFGDVKFMAAIGAFLGWPAVLFSLMVSSIIGAAVGVTLIALRKQEWSSRLPYGPYIALAATLWIFGGHALVRWWLAPMLPPEF